MGIIRSMLDTDLYKVTQGQMVFNQFPEGIVRYDFINRGRTPFPKRVVDAFRMELDSMASLEMTDDELSYLKGIRFMKPTFLEWYRHYRYDPSEVTVSATQLGDDAYDLSVRIEGPWYRTIYWEVPLMAALSELFFSESVMAEDWVERIDHKTDKLTAEDVNWIDFGTRRRASFRVQDKVVERMKRSPCFRGTSNILLAKNHGVKSQGTIAHEAHQAMQAKYGVVMSNHMTLEHWRREYGGDLGVMLPDTLTTDVFMRRLSKCDAKLYDGARQDSGDLVANANKYIRRLVDLDVDPKSKILVPSDALTDDTAIDFARKLRSDVKGITAGIGTFNTNDCGFRPLNIVIKMTGADFGFGMVPVVKLSDVQGKHTGDPKAIAMAKQELGLFSFS